MHIMCGPSVSAKMSEEAPLQEHMTSAVSLRQNFVRGREDINPNVYPGDVGVPRRTSIHNQLGGMYPTTLVNQFRGTKLSVRTKLTTPDASLWIFCKSPTWRAVFFGALCTFPSGLK